MKKLLKFLFIFFLINFSICAKTSAAHLYPEKYYQNEWCSKWGGRAEYLLADKTRVDCLTRTYAVEFDFAPKWAEAVGQSLYYSKMTGKQAAIVLILEKESDFKYFARAKLLSEDNNIQLWYMKSPEYGGYKTASNAQTNMAGRIQSNSDTLALSIKEFERMFKTVYRFVNSLL